MKLKTEITKLIKRGQSVKRIVPILFNPNKSFHIFSLESSGSTVISSILSDLGFYAIKTHRFINLPIKTIIVRRNIYDCLASYAKRQLKIKVKKFEDIYESYDVLFNKFRRDIDMKKAFLKNDNFIDYEDFRPEFCCSELANRLKITLNINNKSDEEFMKTIIKIQNKKKIGFKKGYSQFGENKKSSDFHLNHSSNKGNPHERVCEKNQYLEMFSDEIKENLLFAGYKLF